MCLQPRLPAGSEQRIGLALLVQMEFVFQKVVILCVCGGLKVCVPLALGSAPACVGSYLNATSAFVSMVTLRAQASVRGFVPQVSRNVTREKCVNAVVDVPPHIWDGLFWLLRSDYPQIVLVLVSLSLRVANRPGLPRLPPPPGGFGVPTGEPERGAAHVPPVPRGDHAARQCVCKRVPDGPL